MLEQIIQFSSVHLVSSYNSFWGSSHHHERSWAASVHTIVYLTVYMSQRQHVQSGSRVVYTNRTVYKSRAVYKCRAVYKSRAAHMTSTLMVYSMAQSHLVIVMIAFSWHHSKLECVLNMSFHEHAVAECKLLLHAVDRARELWVVVCMLSLTCGGTTKIWPIDRTLTGHVPQYHVVRIV